MGGWPVGGRLPHIQALIRDATAGNWWSFTDPSTILEALRPADVPGILDEVEAMARQRHQYVVGFVTYEAATGLDEKLPVHGPGALPPAWFAAFDAAKPAPVPAGSGPSPLTWEPSVDATTYREALARIRTYLAAGDAYQVNYSYRLRASLEPGRALDSHRLFHAMLARQPDGLGAFIENDHWAVCSASHELFFLRRGNWLTSRPMKGTVARGATAAEDAQRAAWLRA